MRKTFQLDDWISQAEAARIRGISSAGIVSLMKRGRLETLEIAGKVLVKRKQIEEFLPRRGGRPRKKVTGAGRLHMGDGGK